MVDADLPRDQLAEAFRTSGHHGFPVVADGDRLVGVVTLTDLEAGPQAEGPTVTAEDLCTTEVVTVTPDQPTFRAVARMGSLDVGRIPVVDPDDRGRLVGLVRRSDLVKAYRRAVSRSLADQQRRESSRLRDLTGVHFIELVVDPDSEVADRPVRAVAWPERNSLVSIHRNGDVVMPDGDTVLRAGDEVVVLADTETTDRTRQLFAGTAEADLSPEH